MTKPKRDASNILTPPGGARRVLLHSCCAPCSGILMKELQEAGLDLTVFYYNPNIHPRAEYERRKNENQLYAAKLGIPFVDADYEPEAWLSRVKGWENEPERGKRCTICFSMRMERTALYAHDNGFSVFATSLGLSRLKNQDQVYETGQAAAARYPDLTFWDINWRAGGRIERGTSLARDEAFYRQSYCGCRFSLRDKTSKENG